MATLATYFRQPAAIFRGRSDQPTKQAAAAVEDVDQFALTGLPNDDVYLYCKRIDNSRLVRQADTHVKGEWSTIAGVCAVAVLIGSMIVAPNVAGIMDSYKIQELRREQEQLRIELRKVDVAEEKMLNAPALDAMAPKHNLVRPGADQLIRLQPKNDHSFAMNESFRPKSR
jgi:hypothetical protein